MLEDSKLLSGFISWLAGECRVVSRKRNRLAPSQMLLVKTGGSSRSSLELSANKFRFLLTFTLLSLAASSIVSPSTFYRRFESFADDARELVQDDILGGQQPRLHWIDNFAKYYASNSMFCQPISF